MTNQQTRLTVVDMIRDAQLPANVKALLWAVESRGCHYGRWQTLAADAGLSKNAYYRAKAKAEALGLLKVTRRYDASNVTTVNRQALEAVPRHSPIREDVFTDPGKPVPESVNLRNTLEGAPLRAPSKTSSIADSPKRESVAGANVSEPHPWPSPGGGSPMSSEASADEDAEPGAKAPGPELCVPASEATASPSGWPASPVA